jgi:thiol:disulfide interchange protein DsbD
VDVDDTGSGNIRLAVEIPPDHHGYLDKGDEGFYIPLTFTFSPLEERGARVTLLSRPQGTRDEKAQATVLRGKGDFVFRLDSVNWPPEAVTTATLRYQICNDLTNICYPPRTTDVPIRLANAPTRLNAQLQAEPSVAVSLTLRERITMLFQRYMANTVLALGLVFAAGLVASATPCVYPIIPITAALLMARGAEAPRRGRLHAVVYFLGMVFFYTLLGGLAATTGTALSALMTSAWVNLGFAVVFAYLGLSMLGLYEFQFFSALTERLDAASSRWNGFTGTFLMGSTAGLVVSPCVGPVVGAILLEITGQAALGSATHTGLSVTGRGLTLMTSFGIGLGVPFLIVGLLSNRLPQSGNWLTKAKYFLGLPILYFAYTYYSKGMETAGVASNVAHAILFGTLAIVVAVFIGAFHALGTHPQRSLLLRRACGIVLLIVGTHFLYNGLGHSGILIDVSAPLQSVSTATGSALVPTDVNGRQQSQIEIHGNLHWLRDFAAAQQRASVEQKPVFVDFYATWCANCKAFNRLAMNHTLLNQALQQAILVKIYDTDALFETFQQDQRFPELRGVGGQPFLPLFAIYTPQGTLVWKGQDYQAANTMMAQLDRAKSM